MNTSSHWKTGSKKSNIKGWSYLNSDGDGVFMSTVKKLKQVHENQVVQTGFWSCIGLISSCSFMTEKNSWSGANRGGQNAKSCLLEM